MQITLIPQRRDDGLTLSRRGDILCLNGVELDFAPLPEGGLLPAEAVAGGWLAGPVARVAGLLQLSILLPHGSGQAPAPTVLRLEGDGPIALPGSETSPEEVQ